MFQGVSQCHWMSPFLDESVVDESVFGRKCFVAIWMKVYLTHARGVKAGRYAGKVGFL